MLATQRLPRLNSPARLLLITAAAALLISCTAKHHHSARHKFQLESVNGATNITDPADMALPQFTTGPGPRVIISEVMYANDAAPRPGYGEADPETQDWIELQNLEGSDVDLQDWTLSDDMKQQSAWHFPKGSTVPAGGFLMVLAAGGSNSSAMNSSGDVPFGSAAPVVTSALRLQKRGLPLVLMRPDGTASSYVGPFVPKQMANVSYGIPDPAAALTVSAMGLEGEPSSDSIEGLYTYLSAPTPGTYNSGPLPTGPFILRVTQNVDPPPGPEQDIAVNITVMRNLGKVTDVFLVYTVNFMAAGDATTLSTTLIARSHDGAVEMHQALIPHTAFQAGDMVRWYARVAEHLVEVMLHYQYMCTPSTAYLYGIMADVARDSAMLESRRPRANEPDAPQFYGTVIDPGLDSTVPVMYWFTNEVEGSLSERGGRGCLYFRGHFHDNILVHRRGVTALAWPKPKLKFLLWARDMRYDDHAPAVDEFDLQSYFFELGERSYMKEALGLQMFKEAGVPASQTFHLNLQQNGEFFGLFGFIEDIDDTFLQHHNLSPHGPLYKSVSGELSNLRWDLPVTDAHWYYRKGNRKHTESDWALLKDLTWGLAGGGPEPRSKFLFEHLNLPEVINEMAAQTILNNQDRCTKNFYVYLNDKTREWYRLPWDLDGAFGQDNGLGGAPGNTYCVLACEQWNSPLYCDSEHPQDIEMSTAWGPATVPMVQPYQGIQPAGGVTPTQRARRLLAGAPAAPAVNTTAHQGWDMPDRNTTGSASTVGARGTYNHLTDAILDVAPTRDMYLRRLRTLADQFLASGRIAEMANTTYNLIRSLAEEDARVWKTGISIDRGCQQIVMEYLPTRTEQLLHEPYGPNGTKALLPEAQTPGTALTIVGFERGSTPARWRFVELRNEAPTAVDISGWMLRSDGDAKIFTAAPGTIVPSNWNLHVAPSVRDFRQRPSSPTGGEGHFVVGPMDLAQDGGDALTVLTLHDAAGVKVGELALAQ